MNVKKNIKNQKILLIVLNYFRIRCETFLKNSISKHYEIHRILKFFSEVRIRRKNALKYKVPICYETKSVSVKYLNFISYFSRMSETYF